ncbi:hypothetical protein MLD38_010256 [Melastoma candidum]|uniref:Uncharacterized protein n=1 Tax=Melastoma candidum TaxID=119954 RepID=A0ACB9QZ93_9MYRT|nr:hypothetical protein MLD38_010256 [Melastoma candidum]
MTAIPVANSSFTTTEAMVEGLSKHRQQPVMASSLYPSTTDRLRYSPVSTRAADPALTPAATDALTATAKGSFPNTLLATKVQRREQCGRRFPSQPRHAGGNSNPSILSQDDPKKIPAFKAVEFVESGIVVSFGTGTTARHAVDHISQLLRQGKLRDIVGIPTSWVTHE